MTPHHSTPSVWVVYNNRNEAENLIDRISDFSEGHLWDSSAVNDFLLNIDNIDRPGWSSMPNMPKTQNSWRWQKRPAQTMSSSVAWSLAQQIIRNGQKIPFTLRRMHFRPASLIAFAMNPMYCEWRVVACATCADFKTGDQD